MCPSRCSGASAEGVQNGGAARAAVVPGQCSVMDVGRSCPTEHSPTASPPVLALEQELYVHEGMIPQLSFSAMLLCNH